VISCKVVVAIMTGLENEEGSTVVKREKLVAAIVVALRNPE
jgi:hypothetical protein